MIFIGVELGSVAKSPQAMMAKNPLMKVYRSWKGRVAWSVAKWSGGEKVGGEWFSDEKVSRE